MIRDTITFAFKVMDDKTLPIHLVKQMLTVCSYLRKNQVSLRNEGVKLTKNITELHVEDYECPHGKVSFILKPGITILGGLNGSGKSELFRLFLIGMKKAFSVMHSGTMLLLSKCSLASIRESILYYTPEIPLPVSRPQLYDINPELAKKLGITVSMANLGRPSKGQHALFLIMWIIMVHGDEQGIVILDEVTANLDHENRERVFSVIREYCKGIVIVVDHSVPDDQLDVKLPAPPK
jgi:ABC-type sugar transport system ATPase subunit